MNHEKNINKVLFLIIIGFYIFWALIFISTTSFVAIDGNRYYSLFDDAMISMRYAWNLSHGNGLVWNAGEYVEGYSNLLMTLAMSIFTGLLNKKLAVLGVQIFGIFTVLGVALVARNIFLNLQERKNRFLPICVFALILFYYPLSYWSLMGMETGLLSLFFLLGILQTIRWMDKQDEKQLWYASICFGFAFLARNDALIYSGTTLLYLCGLALYKREFANLKPIVIAGFILGIFVLGQTGFRWFYYDALMPNTYYLKVDQVPFLIRINDGLVYSWSFIDNNKLLLISSLLGTFFYQNNKKWYLLLMILLAGAYQTYVGGDAWGRWRFMIPVMPLAMILSVECIKSLFEFVAGRIKNILSIKKEDYLKNIVNLGFTLFLWYSLVSPYIKEIKFESQSVDTHYNQHNVNKAVALNDVLLPEASIGVFWAGSIPYYTDFYAIDFLGKSDEHIAGLYPHLPSEFVWLQPITLPGHNKYDLNYSIKELQPVYIQRYYWSEQNLRRYALENYVRFEYQGSMGSTTLILKKDSPYVYWNEGKIIQWGE